ncbi:MAG: O-antigen ligase family protein [Bacteroidetes bacterium]|nr:MAG: O-antigen ligase family protein [Bacteroidota bacterium]
MTEKVKLSLFYLIGFLFITLNLWMIYFHEFYWFNLLPVALIVIGFALFSLDKLVMFIVFFTPLSVNLEQLEFGLGLALPTEPLIFGATLLFYIKLLLYERFDYKLIRHPITYAVIFHLAWIFITVFPSEMPLVSFKFFVSRLWFVTTFYFIAMYLFKRDKSNIFKYIWLYILGFVPIIIYTLYNHAIRGFEHQPAHWVMQPFFKDHTSYGAILAMYLPFLATVLWSKRYMFTTKMVIFLVLLVFVVGVIFSYTRAAWVSLAGAFAVFMLMKLRIRFSVLATVALLLIGLFFAFRVEIMQKLEKNRQDSSDELTEHIQSISNVATDASNLERLNRWSCAWRMFKERPVFGWGPGTYMFQYAPFQRSYEMTVISTNFGDLGNAHSEYLGPLAEQGVLGLVNMLMIVMVSVYVGVRLYFKIRDPEDKRIIMAVLLGLITYFLHGLLNNFLDTDKASVPFWGFLAVLTVMDVYYSGKNTLKG